MSLLKTPQFRSFIAYLLASVFCVVLGSFILIRLDEKHYEHFYPLNAGVIAVVIILGFNLPFLRFLRPIRGLLLGWLSWICLRTNFALHLSFLKDDDAVVPETSSHHYVATVAGHIAFAWLPYLYSGMRTEGFVFVLALLVGGLLVFVPRPDPCCNWLFTTLQLTAYAVLYSVNGVLVEIFSLNETDINKGALKLLQAHWPFFVYSRNWILLLVLCCTQLLIVIIIIAMRQEESIAVFSRRRVTLDDENPVDVQNADDDPPWNHAPPNQRIE